MKDLTRLALLGAAAGAAGTTALNAVTYLDMAVRGRPSSSTPEDTVEKLSAVVHVRVPGDGDVRQNRVQGLGPLSGIAAGVGTGALLGLVRRGGWRPSTVAGTLAATLGALLGTNGPMTVLGVTDPRTWPASSWIADIVPHLAYGAATAAVLERLDPAAAAPRPGLLSRSGRPTADEPITGPLRGRSWAALSAQVSGSARGCGPGKGRACSRPRYRSPTG